MLRMGICLKLSSFPRPPSLSRLRLPGERGWPPSSIQPDLHFSPDRGPGGPLHPPQCRTVHLEHLELLYAFKNVRNMEKFLEENAHAPDGTQPILARETKV